MKHSLSFLLLLVILPLVCSGQEVIVSYSGDIDNSTGSSEIIPFSFSEASIFRVRVEASGFSPVVGFHPLEGRGFEWDNVDNGMLIHSDYFDVPMKYTVQVRASDCVNSTNTGFSITITKIEPQTILLGEAVSGTYTAAGNKEANTIVEWYILAVKEPGSFTATLHGDTNTSMTIIKGWEFYQTLRDPDPSHINGSAFAIAEPGIYAVRIAFFERTQGGYTFAISQKK